MDNIYPRSLSTNELIRLYAIMLDDDKPVPRNWQVELLRRLMMASGVPESQLPKQ